MANLDDVLRECSATSVDWERKITIPLANSVPCGKSDWVANSTQRELVQNMGESYGCHTCNKPIVSTPQNFIADHIPPRGIFNNPLEPRITYRFYAHCDFCANKQATQVVSANAIPAVKQEMRNWAGDPHRTTAMREFLKVNGYSDYNIHLLTGKHDAPSMPGHGNAPRDSDRAGVNALAPTVTCHSCGRGQASYFYHADHNPPVEFAMTHWFPEFIEHLLKTEHAIVAAKIKEKINGPFFRPQCPSCSHGQGGRCAALATRSQELMATLAPMTTTRSGRRVPLVHYPQ